MMMMWKDDADGALDPWSSYNLNTCLKMSITGKHWCQSHNRKEQAMQVVANSRERHVSG